MDWDPLSNAVQGLAWPVVREGGVRLDSAVRAAGIKFPATATETVTDLSTYFKDVVGSATYRCQVFAATDLPQGSPLTAVFRPNEDGPAVTGITGVPTNTVGNRYTNVDEAVLSQADYVDITNGLGLLDLRAASAGGLGAGSQVVLTVRVKAVAYGVGGDNSQIAGYVNLGGVQFTGAEIDVPITDGVQTVSWEWDLNPATGLAWTEAEVVLFDSTEEWGLTFIGGTVDVRVYQAWLEVDYVNGTALATVDLPISSDGWKTFTGSWSKTNGLSYVATIRRVGGSGSATLVSLDSGAAMPGSHGAYRPTLDRFGIITTLGDARTEAHPVILHVAGAASADSQPYAHVRVVDVNAGVTVVQEITAGSTADRRWIGGIVARSQTTQPPAAPLIATLATRTTSIAPGQVADAPLAWHVLPDVRTPGYDTLSAAAALTSAVQYDVALTSTAAVGAGWQLAVLDALAPPVSGHTAGFGGATDRGDNGVAESNDLDLPLTIGTVPAAPAGLGATAGAAQITLAWTATSLAGSFLRYILERLGLDGVTWEPIHWGTLEATHAYIDKGPRLGVLESYRLRVQHTNGTYSAPSSTVTATAAGDTTLLVNQTAGTSMAVKIARPATIGFPRDLAVAQRMGDPYPDVTTSPFRRGVTIESSLHLEPATSNQGLVAGFDELLAFLDVDVDQFTLLTKWGERRYVWPIVDGGSFEQAHLLNSPITLVEVAGVAPIAVV